MSNKKRNVQATTAQNPIDDAKKANSRSRQSQPSQPSQPTQIPDPPQSENCR